MQVATSAGGQVALQYSTNLANTGVITSQTDPQQQATVALAAGQTVPLLTDCSQHTQPITNFGHQLLLQPQFFGPGNGLPVLDAAGNVATVAGDIANAYGLQLPAGTDLSQIGFPAGQQLGAEQQQNDKKKTGKKKAAGVTAQLAAGFQATAGMLDNTGHYMTAGNGFTAGYTTAPAGTQAVPAGQPQQPVVDLDSETDSNHDTALTLACAGGHEELVNLLLSRGADIEHRDKKGFTPLILAATAGHDKVGKLFQSNSK